MLTAIDLPKDWYQLKINSKQTIYVNILEQVCTFAPVFHIRDMNKVMGGILGWSFDNKKIEVELEKLRKTLNLQNLPENCLYDPETASEEQRRQFEDQQREVARLNIGLEEEISRLQQRVELELKDVTGEYKDEVSLLNQISAAFFQCTPDYKMIKPLLCQPCRDSSAQSLLTIGPLVRVQGRIRSRLSSLLLLKH
ncbi:hypothetical protein FGO68_gene13149 [Halteria grandinella]|uniref:Uncharacterized protein n=1 Tax=Halteria grandinella TaxID=5974 RepID=A0A8J8T1M1_HALGN|nr:hypothetical protein FGO68_gene13149 [Halteria grandinella]